MATLENQPIVPISIEDEMRKSYLDYAMSVIVSRALPDVRDGLKPVHRRILYAQKEMGNDKKLLKSARVVGDVMGKYHPHGDMAIYDALVRMAQNFSLRLPLEDGQGNFGSMDGDSAAAMRYTEVKLSKAGVAMLEDLDEDTVDWRPNYDGQELEPAVLPTRIPNLLINGAGGIAVGMATNIPPYNLGEVVDGCLHLIDNPEADIAALNNIILGPDFPTGGSIMGRSGILSGHSAGRGGIIIRGKTKIEGEETNKPVIVIEEVPYQVNKAKLVERIAELVKDKVIEDIGDLRDESDRHGVRVVVELKRGANAEVVLNQLYKHTDLQISFSYNMVVLDKGMPRLYGISDILRCFISHREEVVTRRTRFRLGKARDRAHILIGLSVAVANLDEVIKIIRGAADPSIAKEQLMGRRWPADSVKPLLELLGDTLDATSYQLSEVQAQAILDLRLHRLTGLERDKINDETKEISETISFLLNILGNRGVMLQVIREELIEVKDKFATPRKTIIMESAADVNLEDLIQPEDVVVTISSDGYAKRVPQAAFRAQRRGGKGKAAANLRENEEMATLFVCNTHDPVLFFTSKGNVFRIKAYELPAASTQTRGKALVNLLSIQKDETIAAVVPVPRDESTHASHFLVFATEKGMVRKTPLTAYANVRANGIYGMGLNDGDRLLAVHLLPRLETEQGEASVLISSKNGQAVRFSAAEDEIRPIASRTSIGVRGMSLRNGDSAMAMHVMVKSAVSHVLTVTENGYGKLSVADDYPEKGRGTMGVISIQTTDRNGPVVAAIPVHTDDQVMIATADGQMIRMKVKDISVMGRNTQGVRLFSTDGAKVKLVTRLATNVLGGEDEATGGEEPSVIAESDGVVAVAEETANEEKTIN